MGRRDVFTINSVLLLLIIILVVFLVYKYHIKDFNLELFKKGKEKGKKRLQKKIQKKGKNRVKEKIRKGTEQVNEKPKTELEKFNFCKDRGKIYCPKNTTIEKWRLQKDGDKNSKWSWVWSGNLSTRYCNGKKIKHKYCAEKKKNDELFAGYTKSLNLWAHYKSVEKEFDNNNQYEGQCLPKKFTSLIPDYNIDRYSRDPTIREIIKDYNICRK